MPKEHHGDDARARSGGAARLDRERTRSWASSGSRRPSWPRGARRRRIPRVRADQAGDGILPRRLGRRRRVLRAERLPHHDPPPAPARGDRAHQLARLLCAASPATPAGPRTLPCRLRSRDRRLLPRRGAEPHAQPWRVDLLQQHSRGRRPPLGGRDLAHVVSRRRGAVLLGLAASRRGRAAVPPATSRHARRNPRGRRHVNLCSSPAVARRRRP